MVIVGAEEEEIEAIVDTGFNGHLTLPQHIVDRLGLVFYTVSSAIVADGSVSPSSVYMGKLVFDGSRTDVLIDVQPNCNILLGTALLEEWGLSLFVDAGKKCVEFNQTGRVSRP